MTERREAEGLLLQRVPDARQSAWPLFPAVVLPYLALMLGAAAASLAALYNAVALRRVRPALVALAVGTVGWAGFGAFVLLAYSGGVRDPALVVLPARVANIGLGVLLAWSQWAHLRGHDFLGGRTVPTIYVVVAAFAAVVVVPLRPLLVLEGLWILLLK